MDNVEKIDKLLQEQYDIDSKLTDSILLEEDAEKHSALIDTAENAKEKIQEEVEKLNQETAIEYANEARDEYEGLSKEEMSKNFTKTQNFDKAKSLGLEVTTKMKEKEICELIYNYFNA